MSHAASSYFLSGFDEAAILTIDGVGEYASATYGFAEGTDIKILKEISYPHSVGLLYSIVTAYLGFRVFSGEGKVMALAEFGENKYEDLFGTKIVPCIANQIYVFDIDADMHDELMEPIKIEITSTKSIAISNY